MDERRAELQESDIPDTAAVIGIGSEFLGEISPLDTDSTQFEMSDLILGVAKPPHVIQSESFPFPIIPKDPLKRSDSLRVYLEFYHLEDMETNIRLEYEINRVKDKDGSDTKTEVLSKKFDIGVTENNMDTIFIIDLGNLIPGDYELILKASPKKAKTTRTRKASFRIIS
ncbi:hypothetical protein GWN42_06495 [candidate division KSB1 bacterium]|nr:hypothetical protein [candidate division KSB1 bacterium]